MKIQAEYFLYGCLTLWPRKRTMTVSFYKFIDYKQSFQQNVRNLEFAKKDNFIPIELEQQLLL